MRILWNIVKFIGLAYFTVFMVLLAMIIMSNLMLAGLS